MYVQYVIVPVAISSWRDAAFSVILLINVKGVYAKCCAATLPFAIITSCVFVSARSC